MSFSNAPIVLNQRDLTGGSYNNCKFNAVNQNIIQGEIKEIAVSEVNFPYDIPNIQVGPGGPGSAGSTNIFYLNLLDVAGGTVEYTLEIVLPIGFYTGLELAAAIDIAILAAAVEDGIPNAADNVPRCGYVESSNVFAFDAPLNPAAEFRGVWQFSSNYTFPQGNAGSTNTLGKDIFSLMGFSPNQNPLHDIDETPGSDPFPFVADSAAPLVYTQYIDICSPQLCKFQYFRDGSTTNLARRSDVICRLYIANNVATSGPPDGTRPFVINRQYQNARIMRWTADNSVGTIDIQLYDDVGQPLLYKWTPRPYQITFNCYERSMGYGGGGDSSDDDKPRRHAAYKERNTSQAWANLRK